MAHRIGLALVKKPTRWHLSRAMRPWDDKWDWFICGGRWTGALQGLKEQERRWKLAVKRGQLSGPDDLRRNSMKVATLRASKGVKRVQPTFVVVGGGDWIEVGDRATLDKVLSENQEMYAVAVDIHEV